MGRQSSFSKVGLPKMGRILSFSKRTEKRSTTAVVEDAVRAPSPTTAMAMEQAAENFDAAIVAMDEAAAAATAAAEAAEKQQAAEAAEAAAAEAAAKLRTAEEKAAQAEAHVSPEQKAMRKVRESANDESTAWVSSINQMVSVGWDEWAKAQDATAKRAEATSAAEQAASAVAAANAARLEAAASHRKAATATLVSRKSSIKAWVAQHRPLLLLALLALLLLLLAAPPYELPGSSGLLRFWQPAPLAPPPPKPLLHQKLQRVVQRVTVTLAERVPSLARKVFRPKAARRALLKFAAALNPLQTA